MVFLLEMVMRLSRNWDNQWGAERLIPFFISLLMLILVLSLSVLARYSTNLHEQQSCSLWFIEYLDRVLVFFHYLPFLSIAHYPSWCIKCIKMSVIRIVYYLMNTISVLILNPQLLRAKGMLLITWFLFRTAQWLLWQQTLLLGSSLFGKPS